MEPETIQEAIKIGVAKINFGTDVRYKYLQYYGEAISQMNHQGHSWKVSQAVSERLSEDIRAIIQLSGSQNKG
jgi:fructose/tagatose bisphosphate aldolase